MDDVETLDRASHVALVLGFSGPGARRMENMQFVGLQACGISILSCWVDLVSGQLQLSFRRVNLAHGNVHDANGRTSLASQGCSWSSGPGCGPAPGIDRDTASVTRPGYPGPTWMAVTVTRTGPRSIRCISCALPGPVKTVIACCGVPLARRQLPPWPGPARRSLIQSHGKVLTLKRQLDVTLSFPRPQADAASGLRFSRPGPRPPRLRLRHDWFDRTRLSQLWLRVVTIWSCLRDWPGGTARPWPCPLKLFCSSWRHGGILWANRPTNRSVGEEGRCERIHDRPENVLVVTASIRGIVDTGESSHSCRRTDRGNFPYEFGFHWIIFHQMQFCNYIFTMEIDAKFWAGVGGLLRSFRTCCCAWSEAKEAPSTHFHQRCTRLWQRHAMRDDSAEIWGRPHLHGRHSSGECEGWDRAWQKGV